MIRILFGSFLLLLPIVCGIIMLTRGDTMSDWFRLFCMFCISFGIFFYYVAAFVFFGKARIVKWISSFKSDSYD